MKKVRDPAARNRWLLRVVALALAASCSTAWAYDDRGQSPDMAAWEIFTQAVAPSGAAGLRELEFETWASDDDLYAKSPPQWPAPGAARAVGQCRRTFDRDVAKAVGFPDDGCILEEVRRNWAAYRYLVANELDSKAGLARAFQRGLKIDLPADAIQVKADWLPVGDVARWRRLDEADVRQTYYTRVANEGGGEVEYALVALHLNSKRWKNWVWATFEHRSNPGRCDEIDCHDTFGAEIAHIDARTPGNQDYGACPKTPPLLAMFANVGLGPVWLNYCLKGSQVAFTEKDGRPKLLGNSIIDRMNGHIPMAHSSCMTCHALASFDRLGELSDAFADDAIGDVDRARLRDYATNGFVWGAAHAK
jgi:hypothetical protein